MYLFAKNSRKSGPYEEDRKWVDLRPATAFVMDSVGVMSADMAFSARERERDSESAADMVS